MRYCQGPVAAAEYIIVPLRYDLNGGCDFEKSLKICKTNKNSLLLCGDPAVNRVS